MTDASGKRFDSSREQVETLDFDRPFTRLWQFYLAYCEAGFDEGRIDVSQLRLVRES